jgi:hypothetical protein
MSKLKFIGVAIAGVVLWFLTVLSLVLLYAGIIGGTIGLVVLVVCKALKHCGVI